MPQFTLMSTGAPDRTPESDALGHYLVAMEGTEPEKIVEIGAEALTIGRDASQTLVFADNELSRLHARVYLAGGRVIAEDLGSTNGTYLDGARISAPTPLQDGNMIRVGQQLLKYERRDRREVERSRELKRELVKASNYVLSLLPAPIDTGPVRTSWRFLPSFQLGGDAFGHHWLDDDTFVVYLIDVAGHGVGAGMHSVTVLNVLRQRALPDVDFTDPAQVLSSLNDRFQMEDHDGMYFTMWYGVYRVGARSLAYGAAGHHPAYLVPPDKSMHDALGEPELMIGAVPDVTYETRTVSVAPESTLYLFSDGVFEILTPDERQLDLTDFVPHLTAPTVPGVEEPERLYGVVRGQARPGPLDDDFSLVTVTFV